MVPFAGWEMPVEYGGISAEHLAVRTAAGIFWEASRQDVMLRHDHATSCVRNNVAKSSDPPVALVDRGRLRVLLDGVDALAAQRTERGVEATDAGEQVDEGERGSRAHVRIVVLSVRGKRQGAGVLWRRQGVDVDARLPRVDQLQPLVLPQPSHT